MNFFGSSAFGALLLLMCFSSTLRAGHLNFQAASVELGRVTAPTTSFNQPVSVKVDPLSKKVFVCDRRQHRVLRFASAGALAAGASPEAVFGQPDFKTTTPGKSAAKLSYPCDAVLDNAGRLYIADTNNSRVLRFDAAATRTSGAAADGVLGQANFTTSVFATTNSILQSPNALAVFGTELFVADSGQNRVLMFLTAATKPNGAAANKVFGQADFNSKVDGVTNHNLSHPHGVAVEYLGGTIMLWVTDYGNHRILGFNDADSGSISGPATRVLGQTNFTAKKVQLSESGIAYPEKIAFAAGSLYLADTYNNRILRWDSPGAGANGKAANAVYGQPDMSSAIVHPVRPCQPTGVSIDAEGSLWVADTENERILRYNQALTKPADALWDFALWSSGVIVPKLDGGGIAVDENSGKVFVTDSAFHRVLRYANYDSLASGSQPEGVLGQPDFIPHGSGQGAAQMNFPAGLLCSPSGRLWVADRNNNRVLRFDNAANKANGAPADAVLGQAGFDNESAGASPTGMYFPVGLALDPVTGNLWVADSRNNRVLRFNEAQMKANGAAADGVLGQLTLNGNASAVTDRFMNEPTALAYEKGGRLWVLDGDNQRVLRFENASAKPNWGAADGVLGQPDFTTNSDTAPASTLSTSRGALALDGVGRLYVSGEFADRILWWNAAASKPNGAPADGLLGQASFTGSSEDNDLRHFHDVVGLAFDGKGGLWITDGFHQRVLCFSRSTPGLLSYGRDTTKHFFMSYQATIGGHYQVERCGDDLTKWTSVGPPSTAPSGLMFWSETAPNLQKRSFYRIREVAP